MRKAIVVEPCADFHCYEENSNFPERTLLAAVLERSFRDLTNSTLPYYEKHLRREAVQWFDGDCQDPEGLSFAQCAQYLSLTASQIRYIKSKVEEARYINVELYRKDLEVA